MGCNNSKRKTAEVPDQTLLEILMSNPRQEQPKSALETSFEASIQRCQGEFAGWIATAQKVLAIVPFAIADERKRQRKHIVKIHICPIDSSDYVDPWEFLEESSLPEPDRFVGVAAILHYALAKAKLNPKIVPVSKRDREYDLVITAR